MEFYCPICGESLRETACRVESFAEENPPRFGFRVECVGFHHQRTYELSGDHRGEPGSSGNRPRNPTPIYEPLAQMEEHLTFNRRDDRG